MGKLLALGSTVPHKARASKPARPRKSRGRAASFIMKIKKCLFPECPNPERTRGLCHNHYQTAAKLVRTSQVSWEELEVSGKCTARKTGGRSTPVSGWFLEIKQHGTKT